MLMNPYDCGSAAVRTQNTDILFNNALADNNIRIPHIGGILLYP